MKGRIWLKIVLNFFIILVVIFTVYPLFIMLMGSFKSATELASNSYGFPHEFTLNNYNRLLKFNAGIIVRTFGNAVAVSTIYTFLSILVSALAAYAFAKYKFKGRDLLFLLLLSTMMIPGELIIPPLYIMFSKIGWLNTYYVQIFPRIASVFSLFMLRQYMYSIPDALIDSARIDGAGHFRTFWKIIMPTAAPVVGALAILMFLGKWNEYLWPLIMVNDQKLMPIMVILPSLNENDTVWAIPWELILTGCTIVTIPLIIVFFMFQDKFISSVTIGAVKE